MKVAEHKGHTIEIRSSRSDGRWRADARVRAALNGTVYERTLDRQAEQSFADDADTEFYAIHMTVRWVEDHG